MPGDCFIKNGTLYFCHRYQDGVWLFIRAKNPNDRHIIALKCEQWNDFMKGMEPVYSLCEIHMKSYALERMCEQLDEKDKRIAELEKLVNGV